MSLVLATGPDKSEIKAKHYDSGNYPLTVGTKIVEDQPRAVTVQNGRFRIARGYDPSVRIPDEYLRCVAFIGEARQSDSTGVSGDLCATGFFVSVPCTSPQLAEKRNAYFVTAKHVARDLEGKEVYFLVNRKGGGVKALTMVLGNWYLHPTDASADVAIVQVGMEPDDDAIAIAIEHFGTMQRLEQLKIGIGDEVFTIGLFTAIQGSTRNIPIVRWGNIAMLPSEQIQTELGYADVYLVECRSMGGLSGSPVIATSTLAMPSGKTFVLGTAPEFTLLGLMHGHWDIDESQKNKAFFTHDRKHGVNMGIAIVVPASKIIETIYRQDLVDMRQKQEEEILKQNVPGMDSIRRDAPKESITQKEFEEALKKVSRKLR